MTEKRARAIEIGFGTSSAVVGTKDGRPIVRTFHSVHSKKSVGLEGFTDNFNGHRKAITVSVDGGQFSTAYYVTLLKDPNFDLVALTDMPLEIRQSLGLMVEPTPKPEQESEDKSPVSKVEPTPPSKPTKKEAPAKKATAKKGKAASTKTTPTKKAKSTTKAAAAEEA